MKNYAIVMGNLPKMLLLHCAHSQVCLVRLRACILNPLQVLLEGRGFVIRTRGIMCSLACVSWAMWRW